MWYDYIGEERCGWCLVHKGGFGGCYNYVNPKKEFLFAEWLDYAESFELRNEQAIIMFPSEYRYARIDKYGNVVDSLTCEFCL